MEPRMNCSGRRSLTPLIPAIALLFGACASASQSSAGPTISPSGRSPAEIAAADNGIAPYTKADVDFISGMIGHHAQAVLMAGWAPSHGANSSVQGLAERIVVAQRDEIAFMQRWLKDRRRRFRARAPNI
jgi:uncharacterized protein (DUF305 family)